MNEEKISLYKNYFMMKTVSANSIEQAYYSLKGLNLFKDEVFIESDPNNKVLQVEGQGGKTYMRFEAKSMLGTPFIVKSISAVSFKSLTDKDSEVDISKNAQLKSNEITVDFASHFDKLKSGLYSIKIKIEGESSITTQKVFRVVSNQPSGLEAEIITNNKIEIKIEASANHRDISIYAVLRKEDNLPYQFAAKYNEETKKYVLHAVLKDLLVDKINGEYQLTLQAHDYHTNRVAIKKMGSV